MFLDHKINTLEGFLKDHVTCDLLLLFIYICIYMYIYVFFFTSGTLLRTPTLILHLGAIFL